MAVKIISAAPVREVVKQIACRNCGVLLEYVPADVKRIDGRDWSGVPDGCEYVECPNCTRKAVIRSW